MKNFKKLLLLFIFVLTGCVNKSRVNEVIFDYTEHMEIYNQGSSSDGDDLVYFGETTIAATNNGEIAILAVRYSEDKEVLIGFAVMGDLEDQMLKMEMVGLVIYDLIEKDGYQLSLEAPYYLTDELVTTNFETYLSKVKQLTYDDIEYAFKELIQRNY